MFHVSSVRSLLAVSSILSLAYLAGCGGPALASPADGGKPWRQLSSSHFVLRTDAAPERAQQTLNDLEQTFTIFQSVAFPREPELASVVEVTLFSELRHLELLGHGKTAGVYRRALRTLDENTPHMVLAGWYDEFARELVQHELAHHFVAFYYPAAPTWLNEGLAEYFETATLQDGHVVLGEYNRNYTFAANPWTITNVGEQWRIIIPFDAAVPLPELLAAPSAEFYSSDRDSDHGFKEDLRHYASAWALVQTLRSPSYRRAFDEYLARLYTAEEDPESAWATAFAPAGLPRLNADYQRFIREHVSYVERYPLPRERAPRFAERELPADEVHLIWANVRDTDTAEGARAARRDIERALELQPDNPAAHRALGDWELRHGSLELARRAYDRAVAQAGLTAENAQALLRLALHRPIKDATAVARLADALRTQAKTASQYGLIAEYYEALGKTNQALFFANKSIRRDTSCWWCYDTAARIHAARQRWALAAAAENVAVNLLPHGVVDLDLTRRLRSYQQQARSRRRPADTPSAAAPLDHEGVPQR